MKLKKEFENFHTSIKIDNEANTLREKREILQKDFEKNFPDLCANKDITSNEIDLQFIYQGSYILKTAIKSTTLDSDIAVIFSLDINAHPDPRVLKVLAKEALSIPSRTIRIKEPCVTVSYIEKGEEWLHIDFPMYAEHNGTLYLARGKEHGTYSWQKSDPKGLNEFLLNKLKGGDQLRRIIRYVKKWKQDKYSEATSQNEIPPSVALTLLACKHFVECKGDDLTSLYKTMKGILDTFVVSSLNGEIVSASIECRRPVTPRDDMFYKLKRSDEYGIKFYKRLKTAVERLQNACNTDSAHEAAKYVQKVLRSSFVVPAKNAVTSTNVLGKRENSFG